MRRFLVTIPDRIKVFGRLLGERLDAAALALAGWYLARREAAYLEPAFDDLPVLYDEGSFPVLPAAVDKDGYLVLDAVVDPIPELWAVRPLVFEE